MCITNIIISGIIADHYNIGVYTYIYNPEYRDWYNYLYTKPYNRLCPYAFGILCAFILFSHHKHQETSEVYDRYSLYISNSQEKVYVRVLTFITGLILINFLVFFQYKAIHHPGENNEFNYWSQTSSTCFLAFERFVYGLGISLIFLPLLLGHFTLISDFLSLYPWSILGRLTFSMYLINYNITEIYLLSQKDILAYNSYNTLKDSIVIFVLSAIFAVPLTLLIEIPSIKLGKFLLNFKYSKPKESPAYYKEESHLLNTDKEQETLKFR